MAGLSPPSPEPRSGGWETLLDALEASVASAEQTGGVSELRVDPELGPLPAHLQVRTRAVVARIDALAAELDEKRGAVEAELSSVPHSTSSNRTPPSARHLDRLA